MREVLTLDAAGHTTEYGAEFILHLKNRKVRRAATGKDTSGIIRPNGEMQIVEINCGGKLGVCYKFEREQLYGSWDHLTQVLRGLKSELVRRTVWTLFELSV